MGEPQIQRGDIVLTRPRPGQLFLALDGSGLRVFSILNGVQRPPSDPNANSGMVIAGFCCATCQRIVTYSEKQQKPMSNANKREYDGGVYRPTDPKTGKKYMCEACNTSTKQD